jgi:prenyltransferase beta subunit
LVSNQQWMYKRLPVVLILAIILAFFQPIPAKAAAVSDNAQLEGMLSRTITYYKDLYSNPAKKVGSWWQLVGLWGAGENLHDGFWESRLPDWAASEPKLSPADSGTGHIQYIFGLLAMGKDPAHAWETDRNLWAELAAQQNPATGAIGGVNKHIWSMLALESGVKLGRDEGSWNASSKQKALDYLLGAQYADGGFGLSPTGSIGDTDMTGMALLVLSHYQGESAVDYAIEKAKGLLRARQQQLETGGFFNRFGGDNANSLSAAVSGLVSVGEAVYAPDSSWTKNGYTVLDALEGFQMGDGSFKYLPTQTKGDGIATEQALIALLDVKHGASTWSRLLTAPPHTDPQRVTVQLSVYGMDGPILNPHMVTVNKQGSSATAMDALKQSLDQAGIPYRISGDGEWAYLSAVDGQEEATLGGWDGWMYLVNGEMLLVGANTYELQPNDDILFYYSRWPALSIESDFRSGILDPILTIKLVGDTFTEEAVYTNHWTIDTGSTNLRVKDIARIHDQSIRIRLEGLAAEGTISIQALAKALVGGADSEAVSTVVAPTSEEIAIDENDNEVEFDYSQVSGSEKVALVFVKNELPRLNAARSEASLLIDPGTTVTSVWDYKLELPQTLNADGALLQKVNEALSGLRLETAGIDLRIHVGGNQPIQFNQHVTLVLKGQGDKVAGFIENHGRFTPIAKYDDSSARSDEVYSYAGESGDLIVKTKHFTEFIAYQASQKKSVDEDSSSGPTAPSAKTVKLSVEKRTLGEDDIIAPTDVTLLDGDTAYTLLKREADNRSIRIDYTGADASLYVKSIGGLGQFDKGPLSGWMYSVNGVFSDQSAGSAVLNHGDVLRWQYTTNLGSDLGNQVEQPTKPVTPGPGGGSGPISPADPQAERLADAQLWMDGASDWILKQRDFSVYDSFNDWDALALARIGKEVPAAYYRTLESYVREKAGSFRQVTDYERIALAVTSIGKDATNIAGYNFIEHIYNNSRMTNQGTNGIVFALLALDAGNFEVPGDALWTRERLVQEALALQNDDGGFPISKDSDGQSEIDMTAMMLQALAKYEDREEVEAAIERALTWLSEQQSAGGGFKAWGKETSESVSQVWIALSSLGVSLHDKRFVKSDGDLFSALKNYRNDDGGFSHIAGGASNDLATQQALLALAAYDRAASGGSLLFDLSDVESSVTQLEIRYADEEEISEWAKEAVNHVTKLGFMSGTGVYIPAFEPKRELTRAEFAALIVKYAGEQPSAGETGFIDVNPESWYAGYISTAKAKGYISGVSESRYAPEQRITRQEIAVMLLRMQGLLKAEQSGQIPEDSNDISDWARPYVEYAYQSGLMTGDDGYFRPLDEVTREMAAVVMARFHKWNE